MSFLLLLLGMYAEHAPMVLVIRQSGLVTLNFIKIKTEKMLLHVEHTWKRVARWGHPAPPMLTHHQGEGVAKGLQLGGVPAMVCGPHSASTLLLLKFFP